MEVIFDCFFEETFLRLERSGLKSRQKRRDVIDHLNAIILGTSKGLSIKKKNSLKPFEKKKKPSFTKENICPRRSE